MPPPKIEPVDKETEGIMEIFREAYQLMLNDLSRMEEFQKMYDNVVDDGLWPTTSKIPFPLLFNSVEKQLGKVLPFLFPKNQFINLTPIDGQVNMQGVRTIEWALQRMVTKKARLQHNSLKTLKDCFKLSLGYGIVEPIVVTPPTSFIKEAFGPDGRSRATRVMGRSDPRRSVRFKYVGPGRVIVTQDGSDFNGQDRVSWSFYFDTYSEKQLRDIYADQPTDGESTPPLMGNPEEIIAEARDLLFDTRTPIINLVATFAGTDLRKTNKSDERIPVTIPVLKCYGEDRHVWIANGTRIIYDVSEKFQTFRTPLVKASAWPDGDRWVPMSSVEAAQKIAIGYNLWANAMFDIMTHYAKPRMIYDKTKTGNKAPEMGPGSPIGLTGEIQNAVGYVNTPAMPQQLFELGAILERLYGSSYGQMDLFSQSVPGMMRGGMIAFDRLLETSEVRDILGGTILETGYIEPAVEQIMFNMQMNIGPEGEVIRTRRYDPQTREEYIDSVSVTQDDMLHAFELELNLEEKYRSSLVDSQTRLAEFQVKKDDLYFDQYEIRQSFVFDEDKAKREILPEDEVREIQEEQRRLQSQERALGIARARESALPSTDTEEALAGANAAITG